MESVSHLNAVAVESVDPLLYGLPLPLEAEYFPMGFSLRLATNSSDVIALAERMWSPFPKLFDHPSVRLKIVVTGDDGNIPRRTPVLRGQEHLFSIVADADNFANADLRSGFGFICVTSAVAADAAYLRYHFLETLAYVLLPASQFTQVHASCVALDGQAVLLCGGSGTGKTCLAFACAREGWTFLSGDATAIVEGDVRHRVVGRPFEIRFRHTARRLFPELAGYSGVLRPSGKTDIEVDPQDLGLTCTVDATASHVVFLNRSDWPIPAVVEPFPVEEARRRLEESSCFGDHPVRRQQRQALDRLLELPVVQLRYSDLAGAEKALRSLISRER